MLNYLKRSLPEMANKRPISLKHYQLIERTCNEAEVSNQEVASVAGISLDDLSHGDGVALLFAAAAWPEPALEPIEAALGGLADEKGLCRTCSQPTKSEGPGTSEAD